MAVVLKTGKTFNPSISTNYGVDMSSSEYYGVIDRIEYDKEQQMCTFMLNIYGTKELRESGGTVVDRMSFNYTGATFDVIGTNGLSISSAYTMILQDARLTDWESDE